MQQGQRGDYAFHVYAGVSNQKDFERFKAIDNITPIVVNMSNVYSMAMASLLHTAPFPFSSAKFMTSLWLVRSPTGISSWTSRSTIMPRG